MKRILLLIPVLLSAQEALSPPPLAQVLDAEGRLTPVFGISGNFLSGRPGTALLAYSNDGVIEWRLEPGRLSATRDGRTTVVPTDATRANFRGEIAYLPESKQALRLLGDSFVASSDEPNSQLAGRAIQWRDGKLRIFQADGSMEELDCPEEPSAMTAASADWVHLQVQKRAYLLRLSSGRAGLYVLPQRRHE